MKLLLTLLFSLPTLLFAQQNTFLSNPAADSVLRGLYSPASYASSAPVDHPDSIVSLLKTGLSADSLQAYLEVLSSFGNRNTGSDTVSATFGIGAARRWAKARFDAISQANENRLLTGYLQFDRGICGTNQHRNVVAVLPGSELPTDGFILMEAHMDSRCDDVCDGQCIAYGADDNGSGSVLVLELARVMSQFSMERTVVFMLTIGEEQGLFGAEAMAEYCNSNNLEIRAVFNHDIVGGIYCGNSASPPGCPGEGDVDSLNVRLFSFGNYNSSHKQLARFNKLEYKEMLRPMEAAPMSINIMTGEDRVGRGGDHIPFRLNGYTAMRMTSANEHGNGSPTSGSNDRQHTEGDSLGVDLDNDGSIDSFFVDFNYLARNARINGNGSAMIAIGPLTPGLLATAVPGGIAIEILNQTQYATYRIAVRQNSNDWDSVYTIQGAIDTIYGIQGPTILSAASVDAEGIESLFSGEVNVNVPTSSGETLDDSGFSLLPNRPNPFDEQTVISVRKIGHLDFQEAYLLITDQRGKTVEQIPLTLEAELNEVTFYHGFHATGIYHCSLVVDGEVLSTRKMVMQ